MRQKDAVGAWCQRLSRQSRMLDRTLFALVATSPFLFYTSKPIFYSILQPLCDHLNFMCEMYGC